MSALASTTKAALRVALGVLLLALGLSYAAPAASAAEGDDVVAAAAVGPDGCATGLPATGARPCASAQVFCTKWGVDALLRNQAGATAAARFVITANGSTTAPGAGVVTVPAGDTAFRTVHVGEDETISFSIVETTTNTVFFDGSVTRDCTNPVATVTDVQCATGGATVSLSNTGAESAVGFRVQVFVPGSATPQSSVDRVVNAGGSTTVPVTIGTAEGTSRRVVVTAFSDEGPGFADTAQVVLDRTLTVECVNPTATATFACASGITVNLANGGARDAVFTVRIVDGDGTEVLNQQRTVAGGGSDAVVFGATQEGESYTVTVTEVTAGTLVTQSFTVDCVQPTATAVQACASGITVTLANTTGQRNASFTVRITDTDGDVVLNQTRTVAGGASTTVNLPGTVEGERYTVAVTEASQGSVLNQSFTVDCVEATASIAHTCATGIVSTLGNAGELPTTFTVTITDSSGDVVSTDEVTVNGGTTATSTFTDTVEGETYTVTVTETTAGELASDEITIECVNPAATAVHDCADGVVVTLTNTGGELPVSFTVVISTGGEDVLERTVEVAPGGSSTVTFPDTEEGTTYDVVVTTTDGTVLDSSVTVECVEPEAVATFTCADGLTIDFSNDGEREAVFTVVLTTEDSVVVVNDTVTVAPGDSVTGTFDDLDEDVTYSLQITEASQDEPVLEAEVVVDCVDPTAAITHTCADGPIVVTLTNPGAENPAVFTVVITDGQGNQTVNTTVSVDPDATQTVRVETPDEDESYRVVVTEAEIGPVADVVVPIDCEDVAPTSTSRPPTQVGGTTQTRTLPRTGSEGTTTLALVAGMLLAGGLLLVSASRRTSGQPLLAMAGARFPVRLSRNWDDFQRRRAATRAVRRMWADPPGRDRRPPSTT